MKFIRYTSQNDYWSKFYKKMLFQFLNIFIFIWLNIFLQEWEGPNAQLTKIWYKNILLKFPLSYENVISECSLKVQNFQFLTMFLLRTSSEHSILSFCKHYWNVTFECSLNCLKQAVPFKKMFESLNNTNALLVLVEEISIITLREPCQDVKEVVRTFPTSWV